MRLTLCLKTLPPAHKWFARALMLLALFVLYTAIFLTGALLSPTLHLEQWLLHRPLTGIDCVFHQWRRFGQAPTSLFFTCILGIGCLWLGYRRRVLPYLLLLMVMCIGSEVVGKQIFPQPVPVSLESGMSNLGCQQMSGQSPLSLKLKLVLGMWWEAPRAPAWRIQRTRASANTPFTLDVTATQQGYPSGHAIRWMFLGLILNWLVWKHIRKCLLRRLLLVITLAIAFGGGLLLVYTGSHLATDLLAGYLIGASAACCAIGLLSQNETSQPIAARNEERHPTHRSSAVGTAQRDGLDLPALCEAAKVFLCVVRVVRFSHQCRITCVGVRVRLFR